MASIASSTHLPALDDPHEREGVGRVPEATPRELADLAVIGRQLHWAVVGSLLRPLRLHLDELVDSWRELGDTVAERAVAPGCVVVRELTHRVAQVRELVRTQMGRLDEADLAARTS